MYIQIPATGFPLLALSSTCPMARNRCCRFLEGDSTYAKQIQRHDAWDCYRCRGYGRVARCDAERAPVAGLSGCHSSTKTYCRRQTRLQRDLAGEQYGELGPSYPPSASDSRPAWSVPRCPGSGGTSSRTRLCRLDNPGNGGRG